MEKHDLRPVPNARSPRGRADPSRPLPDSPDVLKKASALVTDTLRRAAARDVTADAALNRMLEAVGSFLGVSRAT